MCAILNKRHPDTVGEIENFPCLQLMHVKKTASAPAIEATEENVVSGKYPISRYLYLYLNPALDKGEVADFITWIRSDEGHKLVKEVGYFPLPKNLRE